MDPDDHELFSIVRVNRCCGSVFVFSFPMNPKFHNTVHRTYKVLFIYYTVGPYNRTKEISKNGDAFAFAGSSPVFTFPRRRFLGDPLSGEGRRKVQVTLPSSSDFFAFPSLFLRPLSF